MNILYHLLFILFFIYWGCEEKVVEDTTPPTVSIISPINGSTVNEIVIITCISSDNEDVAKVELWINGVTTDLPDNTEPYLFNWNTTLVVNGNYTISIRSYDTNENTTDSEPILLTVDNTQSNPQPINITSVVFDNGGFTITWNQSIDGDFSSYELEKSTDSIMNNPFVVFTTDSLEQTTYFDTDVNPLTYQYYRVTVIDTFNYETKGQIISSSLDPGTEPSLKELGAIHGIEVGTSAAVKPWHPITGTNEIGVELSDPIYVAFAMKHFARMTPSQDMLNNVVWDQPSDFTDASSYEYQDQVQNFVNATTDFHVHGAHMVWHSAMSPWMSTSSGFVGDDVVNFMENHIANMALGYTQVTSWNVVNEAISDNPISTTSHVSGNLRETIWKQEVGDDYIERAFQIARQGGVETLLYNDYGIDLPNATKTQAVLQLVTKLNDMDLIDGIGLQSHLAGNSTVPTIAEFRSNIAQFAALGLEVHITEFDITHCLTLQCRDVTGPQIAYNLASACREEPACVSFTFWGMLNDRSWLYPDRVDPSLYSGRSLYALPFDSEYGTTPIFDAIVDAWQ